MYKKLIENLKLDLEWAQSNEWESPICLSDDIKEALNIIENLQYNSDLKPIVYAKWLYDNTCSNCGEGVIEYDNGTLHGGYYYTEFCPNCGAKMIKE